MTLNDKIILITGASSGIGAAAALLFAQHGAKLVIGARRKSELTTVADQIAQSNGNVAALTGDVADEAYHQALVALAQDRFGGLDGAFNNAGTLGEPGPLPAMTTANWNGVIATNLTSAFYASRHQIPAMLARGGGSLIFTSSFVGHTVGMPGLGAYAASKAGLVGLVQTLAAEYGVAGLRVNALLPGGTRTAMADSFGRDPETVEFVKSIHALKRMADPQEIARAALFLASDASSFVTGTAMLADGGTSICKT